MVNYVQDAVIQYDLSGQEIKRFARDGLRYIRDTAFDSKGNLHIVGLNDKMYVLILTPVEMKYLPTLTIISFNHKPSI